MQYPLISEYLAAIRDAHDNLDKLSHLVPVLDNYGEPYRSSGAFAVVFKMKDEQTGKCYALKCFTEEQEGRAEAYRQIAEELEFVNSPYITSVKYLEKELFVDSNCEDNEFPVLLMDWIEGETMETYIADHYMDNYAMSMLCYRFCKMAAWLRSQPFAHGDIKPDNIMVRSDGTLTLVDYDGMFVPAMKGQKSPTIGTKDFSHPLRTIDDFDETIDDFALASMALSLKAISLNPSLLDEYGASDRLLFSAADYLDLSKSKTMTALQGLLADEETKTLLSMFLLASAQKNLSMCSFRLFGVEKPREENIALTTNVKEKDIQDSKKDDYGVRYNKRRLLKAEYTFGKMYPIKWSTKIICDNAFNGCHSLNNIEIPSSVLKIGDKAFFCCNKMEDVQMSSQTKYIGAGAFAGCESLKTISISSHTDIDIINEYTFYGCKQLENIEIPQKTITIGKSAFSGCINIKHITIPSLVTKIGDFAFYNCKSLELITIPLLVTRIGDFAFSGCENLKTITILSNCNIGDYAFSNCRKLEKINISPDIVNVGYGAFYGCENLSNDTLKDLYERFGPKAFEKEKIRKRRRTNSIENSIELQVALTNAIWKCY